MRMSFAGEGNEKDRIKNGNDRRDRNNGATDQSEGGAHDIATRERIRHIEGIFLTKSKNSLPIEIDPSTWRC